jgi:hypothetical protein
MPKNPADFNAPSKIFPTLVLSLFFATPLAAMAQTIQEEPAQLATCKALASAAQAWSDESYKRQAKLFEASTRKEIESVLTSAHLLAAQTTEPARARAMLSDSKTGLANIEAAGAAAADDMRRSWRELGASRDAEDSQATLRAMENIAHYAEQAWSARVIYDSLAAVDAYLHCLAAE